MPDFTGYAFGRYHLIQQLGEGGMATVYKAFDTRLERDVAVKILRTEQFSPAQLEQVLQRFDREAKSLGKLSHSNIVSVLDYGEHESVPYLVMEYLPGGTLKQKLGTPLPWQDAVRILIPVARALAYAHLRGIIHRDVKPANVLLKEDGTPILTDFGIAKLLEGTEGHTLTASGVGIGTPEYMAPEQGMGAKIDARVDIYALGIVLYELVTGRKPYLADTPMAVLLKHMTDPLPNPCQFVPDLPIEVEKVLIKALAKQPEDRYETMTAFVEAMEMLLSTEKTAIAVPLPPVDAPTVLNLPVEKEQPAKQVDVSLPSPPPRVKSGKKWLWSAAIGGCLVVVALAAAVILIPRLLMTAVKSQPSPSAPKAIVQPTPIVAAPPADSAPDCRSERNFCVGLVMENGKIDDKSFNQAIWEGVQQAKKQWGAIVNYHEATSDNFAPKISDFAQQGYDVIVLSSYRPDITAKMAEKYPQVKFIAVDQYQDQPLPNVAGLVFHEDQSGFLVGVLAAMITKSDMIGAVLGTDEVPAVWRFGEGYRAGARFTKQWINVILVYHNNVSGDKIFNDPQWGGTTANNLIDQGADVIFGAGGSTGNGAIIAAAQRKVYVIGVDVDQYFMLPSAAPQLLTSAIKDVTPGILELIRLAKENSFPKGNFYAAAGYAPFHDMAPKISLEMEAKLIDIREQLANGQIQTGVSPQKP
jgi:basic membrane protein A